VEDITSLQSVKRFYCNYTA